MKKVTQERMRHETVTFKLVDVLRVVASEECGSLLLRGGIFGAGNY
jgi:hypothetical protein